MNPRDFGDVADLCKCVQAPPMTAEWWMCHVSADYEGDWGEEDECYYAEVLEVHIEDDGLAKSAYDVQNVGEEAELEERVLLSRSTT